MQQQEYGTIGRASFAVKYFDAFDRDAPVVDDGHGCRSMGRSGRGTLRFSGKWGRPRENGQRAGEMSFLHDPCLSNMVPRDIGAVDKMATTEPVRGRDK